MKIQCFHSSSLGNLYSVSDGQSRIMIECGVEFKEIKKCFEFSLSALEGCLVTHQHGDHAKSWKDVARYTPVYMLQDTAKALKASGYNLKHYTPMEVFNLGTFTVLPIPAVHDVPCCSFIIRSKATDEVLLFATDTAYLRNITTVAHYAMVECNYQREIINEAADSGKLEPAARNRIMASHMEFRTTLEILKQINPKALKEIYILHLSNRHADAEKIKKTIEQELGKPVTIAEE